MKRLSLIFALSIVLLSFGLSSAFAQSSMTFDVQLQPGEFSHPIKLADFYKANTNMQMDILMGNSGDVKNLAHQFVLQFYGKLNGVASEVPLVRIEQTPPFITTWKDGGFTEDHSWYMNPVNPGQYPKGALPNQANFFATGMMGLLDTVVVRPGWGDGTLPDTFAYAGSGQTGLPIGGLLPRLHFFFSVPIANIDDVVEICVDSSGYPAEDQYDWQFDNDSEFGGPYCFAFAKVPNLPPEAYGTPLTLSVEHQLAFSLHVDLRDTDDPALDDITAVLALDENGDPIGTISNEDFDKETGSFDWTFPPPCTWVGETGHKVIFYAEDDTHGHTYAGGGLVGKEVELTATNTAPIIDGNCGATFLAGINKDKSAYFTSTDDNSDQDAANWSVDAVAVTEQPNLGPVVTAPYGTFAVVDGVFTFHPLTADDGATYVFTIRVTDCALDFDECDVTFEVISQEAFVIGIEVEDGSPDGDKGSIDGDGVYLGHHALVDVTQTVGTEDNLGFDFLIAYDNSALAFLGAFGNPDLFAIPGTYEWEYFTYRFVDNCGGSCPSGLLQVVAIANQNDGLHIPVSVDLTPTPPGDPMVLFTMDFMVTGDYTMECTFVPISFFWRDCSDNSIAMHFKTAIDPLEIIQAISRDVYGYNGGYHVITDKSAGFPTYYGSQDECLLEGQFKYNTEFIDFYNGGVKIICTKDIDDRGDINLNGVAYEIADAVVFTNYFIYGLSAFTIMEEGQKAATDVNADGIPLSVADLVYMIRVITGDILPIPGNLFKLSPNTVEANFGFNGQLVTVDVELGAALFVLEGNVDVSLAQDAAHMDLRSGVVNGNTHVLVYSFDKGAAFSGNVLNTEGKMISVEAAGYNSSAYKTIVLPTTFSVQNYPNPFNPATTISMALPTATSWNLTIYNVAGQKVAEFSGFAEAGINNVVWDASSSASGIYFYKVSTDTGSMTKKMVLLK